MSSRPLSDPERQNVPHQTRTSAEIFEDFKSKVKKPTITCSLIFFLILNIMMFVVGVAKINECPVKTIIPIYLIIAGAIGVITKILPIMNRNTKIEIINHIVYGILVFEIIWMLLGTYWIYGIYQPDYNPASGSLYCNKTAYLLAFWLLTINYICIILVVVIPCLLIGCCGIMERMGRK